MFATLVATLVAIGAVAEIPTQTGLSMYIARMAGTALPYREAERWQAYLTISRIAEVLLHRERETTDVATLTTTTFDGFPLLVLTDQDGGLGADFFTYYEDDARESTLEFGAFFTVGEDPAPAWIVFNNGTIPEAMDPDNWVLYWATHQYVDRDRDGRFDLYIGSGIDTDEDGRSGTEDTVWLYDDDQDGRIDRAETNVAGVVQAVDPVDGSYHLGGKYGRDVAMDTPFFTLPTAIAADIRNALDGGNQ